MLKYRVYTGPDLSYIEFADKTAADLFLAQDPEVRTIEIVEYTLQQEDAAP